MKLSKFTVIIAVLLMAILAIGAVSAESIGDADASLTSDSDLTLQSSDDSAKDVSAVDTVVSTDNAVENNLGDTVLGEGDDTDPDDEGGDTDPTDEGGDTDPEPTDENVYKINDETYSTYFNDNGTPTDALSADGNYQLEIGLLNGKNITINSGSNINISAGDYEKYDEETGDEEYYSGDIYDGIIILGNNVESVFITGLKFHNTNLDAIHVDGCKDVTLCENNMYITTESNDDPYLSISAILLNGAVSNIEISENYIYLTGDAPYNYGIDLMCYGANTNPTDITISHNRIEMEGNGQTGMLEGMYLSDPVNLVVEYNDVVVNTVNDVYAYGIQVADDVHYVYMYEGYTGSITSPRNIEIKENNLDIKSEFMAYALSVLNYGVDGYDPKLAEEEIAKPHYYALDTNTTISENIVIARSDKGVMGIAGQTYNMTVINNELLVIGGSSEGIVSTDALGNGTYALEVQYNAVNLADNNYTVVVRDNSVVTNVTTEHINSESNLQYVTFENNTSPSEFVVNDQTYSIYFNDDGTPKDILPAMGDYVLVIDFLNDKNITIASGSNINITGKAYTDDEGDEYYGYIGGGTITIGDGAGSAGSIIISNLDIDTVNGAGINILDLTNKVTIDNCRFSIIGNSEESEDSRLSVYAINANGFVSDLTITNNNIRVHGDAAYSYGIQLGSYGALANPENIYIANNDISVIVEASCAEAIYLDNPVNAVVEFNNVTVKNEGDYCAYGIQVADSAQYVYYAAGYEGTLTSAKNVLIKDNKFDITSDFMIYGITVQNFGVDGYDTDATFSMPLCYQFDLNTTIVNNTVVANSKKGVIGIGGQTYNMTVINNDVTAIGTSAEDMTTGDALGNHTSALCVQYNGASAEDDYYVIVKDNKVTTNVLIEEINSQSYLTYVTFENNSATPIIVINDETYSTYFNDDGTAKDTLPEDGGYALYIDQIHDKNIIIASGSGITISALTDYRDALDDYDGEGEVPANICNGTIIIGDGTGNAGSITVSGLTFVNHNKNAIEVNDLSTDINIANNTIKITSEPVEGNEFFSVYGVNANGYIYGLTIEGNDITVRGEAPYQYGIQLGSYGAISNPDEISVIRNNIHLYAFGDSAIMAEAIYLDSPINALIDGNEILVTTEGNVFAYGIQVADSAQYVYYKAGYEGEISSPANVTITNNELDLNSEYMIYGITFQSFGAYGYDEDMLDYEFYMPNCYQFELNTTIANNTVYAYSEKGVIGIGALAYNVTIAENEVSAYGTSAEGVTPNDALGVDTYALGVNFNAASSDDDYYSYVINNRVVTDVTPEHINSEDYYEYVTFENNTLIKVMGGAYVIDDSNYDAYFDEEGKLKEESPIGRGDEVLLGNLTNKKLTIDIPLTISALEDSKLVNSTINLVEGADETTIDGLTFEFTGDNTTGSIGLIYANGVSNINITNNKFFVPDFVDKAGSKYGSSIYAIEFESGESGCNNVIISGNEIEINGSARYLYGIDVFQTWESKNKNTNVTISENKVTINGGSRMAEAIYASAVDDLTISDNTLSVVSEGSAYGMGTDSLSNAVISGNIISANATVSNMVYGIANTYSNNVKFENNDITANGRGAVGIGVKGDTGITIDGNTINVTGRDYQNANTSDSIGKANAAIYNADESEVTIGENTIIENFPVNIVYIDDVNYNDYFDAEGKIIDGTIAEKDIIKFGDLTGKNMVIDIPVTITATEGTKLVNSTISLVEGADGTTIDGLDMEFTGDENSGSFAVISAFEVSDIAITNNNIVIPDSKGSGYAMAIEVEGLEEGCDNVTIVGNTIDFKGSTAGMYGIDVFTKWKSSAVNTNFVITDNVVNIEGATATAEPMYLNTVKGALVANNTLNAKGGEGATTYGIGASTANDTLIADNKITANGTAMTYGISSTKSDNVTIENNNITTEGTGAIGVGLAQDSNAKVTGNDVKSIGGDYTTTSSGDSVGTGNGAIVDRDGTNTVENNVVSEIGPKTIDDTTYSQFFDENGKLKEDCSVVSGDTLLIGTLTNKKMIVDIPVAIKGLEGNKLVNTTISLVDGADGTSIDGLNMEFTGDNTTGSIGLIYAKGVSDIAITNNNITVPDFVDQTGAKYGSSIYAIEIESGNGGCDNVTITGNNIDITGSARYLYGIDIFKTWQAENKNSNINISNNNVTINGGSRMAEPIYVSESDDVVINNNIISSTSQGAAYGIATDQLIGAEIKENSIVATSQENMAYGITSTTLGANTTVEGNNVTATGVGAVGVGISGQENVTVNGNNIDIVGGDFTTISTADNLGTANAAILVKDGSGNEKIDVGKNTLTENGKSTNRVMTGNGTKDLQNIVDDAKAGSTVDLTGQYFKDVGTVVIDKDIAINGGKIIGAEGKPIFEIASKSSNGPNEVNITGVDFVVNNANTIVKVDGKNATDGTSIDVPAVNIKGNNIDLANDDVVAESVTVLELDSDRPILSPNKDIVVSGNTLPAGVDPFDFKVTSISSGGDTVITPQNISVERKATFIKYSDMVTNAVDYYNEGRVGEYFKWTLVDAQGKPIANKPMQIGFNGVIYKMTTDKNGKAQLQINLGYKGDYTFAITFLGDDNYNASFVVAKIKVNPQKPTLTVPNKSYKASAKTKALTATFKSVKGKLIAKKKVTFTVNGKTYTAKTNAKGVATVKVSLNKKGTYNFTAKFAGDSTYAAVTKKAKLTIK